MKIAFVRPNYTTYFITPPLGIGYLSSVLKKRGFQTKIFDGVCLEVSLDSLISQVIAYSPDLICITCLSAYFEEVKYLSLKFKEKNFKVIIGGVHPTFMPQETLIETKADFVILGEGENVLPDFLENGFDNDGLKGVYSLSDFEKKDKTIERAPFVTNLDDIPFPDLEALNPNFYPPSPMGMVTKGYPIGVMISSRGCPCSCIYCSSSSFYEHRVRLRSAENVVAEMKHLIENYGVKEIQFMDDNLILNRQHAVEICNLILKENIKINWSCPNGIRADSLDYELAVLLKKAGCYLVTIGIESANPQILKNVKKGETIDVISKAIRVASKAGLIVHGAFVLGLPGETKETIRETINFAKKLPLNRAFFTLIDVLPGCELWKNDKEKYKNFLTTDSYAVPAYIPEGLTKEYLMKAQERAMFEFYFRPRILFDMIKLIRFKQLKYIFRRLLKFRLLKK